MFNRFLDVHCPTQILMSEIKARLPQCLTVSAGNCHCHNLLAHIFLLSASTVTVLLITDGRGDATKRSMWLEIHFRTSVNSK